MSTRDDTGRRPLRRSGIDVGLKSAGSGHRVREV